MESMTLCPVNMTEEPRMPVRIWGKKRFLETLNEDCEAGASVLGGCTGGQSLGLGVGQRPEVIPG